MVLATAQKTTTTARPAANRGSGRVTSTRWYRIQCGGYETIYTPDGEPMAPEFVLDGFNIEMPDTFLGLGTREAIEAAALEHCPDKELIDFWPLSSAPADEF
jgi:hypothetical protein